MSATPFDTRSREWAGDMTVWLQAHDSGNQEQMERLRRHLRQARERELTPRQQQVLLLYYEQNMNCAEIARMLGLNRSTVSRTVRRARERLRRCLQYAL